MLLQGNVEKKTQRAQHVGKVRRMTGENQNKYLQMADNTRSWSGLTTLGGWSSMTSHLGWWWSLGRHWSPAEWCWRTWWAWAVVNAAEQEPTSLRHGLERTTGGGAKQTVFILLCLHGRNTVSWRRHTAYGPQHSARLTKLGPGSFPLYFTVFHGYSITAYM